MSQAVTKRWSKAQIVSAIAESTGLSKKDVGSVLDGLDSAIESHITTGSVGEFVLPGLLKIKRVEKPARAEREGVNPFTGCENFSSQKTERHGLAIAVFRELTASPAF